MSAGICVVKAGQKLRITDTEGGQPGDMVIFSADNQDMYFSQARTRVENGVYRLTEGAHLWSNTQPPAIMMSLVSDTGGGHDLLYTPCCRYALEKRYGIARDGCLENLTVVLKDYGVRSDNLPDPLNLFMRVDADPDGTMHIRPSVSTAGDHVEFRAEINCLAAIATCPVPRPDGNNSGFLIEISGDN